jgi:hypothetical protein
VYSIAAGALFRVPAWRNVFTWMGARPATAANFRRLLRRGSVGLIPGVRLGACMLLFLAAVLFFLACKNLCRSMCITRRDASLPTNPNNNKHKPPKGIAEMFLSRAPEADVVMLLQRKGFVRLAVEAGAPLVPIYVRRWFCCVCVLRDLFALHGCV